jgi:anti-anti-sigma regulatory factor
MAPKHALPGDVTIYAVGALQMQIEGWIEDLPQGNETALNDTPLVIDASGVNEVDAAGVQLLLSFSKSLVARRRTLRLTNASGPLAGACDTLGVAGLLIAANAGGAAE